MKYSVAAPGQTEPFSKRVRPVYFARFPEGVTGSAQLQVLVGADWLPMDAAVTATMTNAKFVDASAENGALKYRWNVSAVSGGFIELWLG
jgi:hypothetical protein